MVNRVLKNLDKFLEKSTRVFIDGCCCCLIKDKNWNPYLFLDNSPKYLSCCGSIHINQLTTLLIYAKTLFISIFVLYILVIDDSETKMLSLGSCLLYLLALLTYVLLFIGMRLHKFHYFIPYFFVSFICLMVAVTYFFIDFLDSANTRDTTERSQIKWFLIQVFAIFYEVYTLITVWRVFNYVCDVLMDAELRQKGIIVSLPSGNPIGTVV